MDNVISDELMKFILDNVKLMLNIQEPLPNADEKEKAEYDYKIKLLTLLINQTCQEIIIRTNRNAFPEDLKYLVINMVCDNYNAYTANANADDNQVIQSMSEEGRSITYTISDNTKTKLQLTIKRQLDSYDTQINRYKLLYKVGCPYEKS